MNEDDDAKFTVILFPDEDGYTVIVPYYPEVTTWGQTPEEAFEMAQECLELAYLKFMPILTGDQVLPGMDASHVIVGTIEAEAPDILLNDVREHEAEMERRRPEEERLRKLRQKEREREAMAMLAGEGEVKQGTLRSIQRQARFSE